MALEDRVEFAVNPEPRCACVLLLDTSSSMAGKKIDSLNQGLRLFREALMQDEKSRLRVEIAVVSFDSEVNVVQDFATADYFEPPVLAANGSTVMGKGLLCTLDFLEQRKADYKKHGIEYYRPWVFMITDGEPTDTENLPQASKRVIEAEEGKRAVVFAVGVEDANMARLQQLVVRAPVRLAGLKFQELFLWLSQSMQAISRSRISEQITLPPPMGWMQI